jgi:DnaJ-like protein
VNGRIFDEDKRQEAGRKARVCWCLEKDDGSYRSGLALEDGDGETEWNWEARVVEQTGDEQDHYEVLQLSPTAHPETIQRVYRMLAQRYHPDNTDTGNEEIFKNVLEAYRVLSDAERRAAFDVRHGAVRRARWNIFESAADSRGVEGERRKRQGILALLYARRLNEPDRPATSIRELEDLLGCPRDHLQVSLWYLKEKLYLKRDDRGQYSITVDGVDECERLSGVELETQHLLPEGKFTAG